MILIVGGGLAGLALGQGLKAACIPFKIFERDAAASFRAQGYRIRIDENGGQALQKLLPSSVFRTFESTCAPVIAGGHRLDAATGKPSTTMQSKMPKKPGRSWNADRTVLRNVLLMGLEDSVQFGKKFIRYELVNDGTIAYFDDGTTVKGSMLVGTDGIRSKVRRQMLPGYVLLDTEGRAVFGKTLIETETFDNISREIADGLTMTSHEDKPYVKLLCDMMRFTREPSHDVSLPRDYIYWVLAFQKDDVPDLDDDFTSYSGDKSIALADRLMSGWHTSIRRVVTDSVAEASSTLRFTMSRPDLPEFQNWQTDPRITLIGDSLHPMPPTGGVGANAAFCDVKELVEALKGEHEHEHEHEHRKAKMMEFENRVRTRNSGELKMSAQGAVHIFGLKPLSELKAVQEAS